MARQGDVLFTAISRDELPPDLVERKSRVVVEGEVTGHAHRLVEGRVLVATLGAMYLEVLHATQVVHEEHNPITLSPGYYRITQQREYVAPDIDRLVLD